MTSPPPADLPGNRLDVDLTGIINPVLAENFIAGAGYSGSWTFGGGIQPVTFETIETLTPTSTLTVTTTDGATVVAPGAQVTYTITVSNTGPRTATGATLHGYAAGGFANSDVHQLGVGRSDGEHRQRRRQPQRNADSAGGRLRHLSCDRHDRPSRYGHVGQHRHRNGAAHRARFDRQYPLGNR